MRGASIFGWTYSRRGTPGRPPDLRPLERRVKEGLVEKVLDWPGVHAAPALLSGLPLEGIWYDRTKEYLVKIKGKKTDPDRFAEPETPNLAPLPCWSHLSPEAYRTRIAKLIDQIEADAAAQREATGRKPLGANLFLRASLCAPQRSMRPQSWSSRRFQLRTSPIQAQTAPFLSWAREALLYSGGTYSPEPSIFGWNLFSFLFSFSSLLAPRRFRTPTRPLPGLRRARRLYIRVEPIPPPPGSAREALLYSGGTYSAYSAEGT